MMWLDVIGKGIGNNGSKLTVLLHVVVVLCCIR
jgi:hypothetical protein